jgi:hypothetical protein
MFRLARRTTRPFLRSALVVLVWNHRQTVGIWGRSLLAELRRGGKPEISRIRHLLSALYRMTRGTFDDELDGVQRLVVIEPDMVVVEGDGIGVEVAANALASVA